MLAKQNIAIRQQDFAVDPLRGTGEGGQLSGRLESVVIDGADRWQIDHVLAISPHHRNVMNAAAMQRIDQPPQQRLATDVDHAFGPVFGQRAKLHPARRGEDDGVRRIRGARKIFLLRFGELVIAGDLKYIRHGGDGFFNSGERLFPRDPGRDLAHRGDRGPQIVICPDNQRHARLAPFFRGRVVIGRRHDHHRTAISPFLDKGQDFSRIALL